MKKRKILTIATPVSNFTASEWDEDFGSNWDIKLERRTRRSRKI